MRKQVKGNLYNHLEKYTPVTTQTSCSLKQCLKDSPCSTEWIDVSYKPLGCIFSTIWSHFLTACAIKKDRFWKTYVNTFLLVIRHLYNAHKAQNVVLQR